jgi:hypothetical protein
MKEGPNFSDANRIRRLHNEGLSLDDISQHTQVKVAAVEAYLRGRGLLKQRRRKRTRAPVEDFGEVSNG